MEISNKFQQLKFRSTSIQTVKSRNGDSLGGECRNLRLIIRFVHMNLTIRRSVHEPYMNVDHKDKLIILVKQSIKR